MAKSRFTYSCGHDGVVTGHNRSNADYLARKYSAEPCRDCEYAAAQQAAADAARAAGLPQLTGTPKQIAYGEVVRAARMQAIDRMFAAMPERLARFASLPSAAVEEINDALALIRSEWLARTEARAWLDEKGSVDEIRDTRDLLDLMGKRGLVPIYSAWLNSRRGEA